MQRTSRKARQVAEALASVSKSAAILQACIDYHGGQNSRGYRLLCLLQRRVRRAGVTDRTDLRAIMDADTYTTIVSRYWRAL